MAAIFAYDYLYAYSSNYCFTDNYWFFDLEKIQEQEFEITTL